VTRLEVERVLPVGRTEGFDYITDVRNWATYWPHVIDVRDADRTSWSQAGDRASVVVESRGNPVEMSLELDELVPYERVTYRSVQPGLPDFWHERHFGERDGSLDYRLVIAYEPRRGMSGLIDRVFVARAVRQSLTTTLDNLERIFRARSGR